VEVKRLKEIYENTPDPKSQEREERFPGYYSMWCSFKAAHHHLALRDCVVLVHSPQGCIGNARAYLTTYVSQFFGLPFPFSPSTSMNVADAILGSEDKLRKVLHEVCEIYKPKMIFLLVTCCAGVIRESVEEVAKEMEEKLGMKIMVIRAEGFTYYCNAAMHEYISSKLSELFEDPKDKIPLSVNILGISKEIHHRGNFPHDSHELERLLNRIGLRVNSVLLEGASLEAIKRAPMAEYNVFDCPQWGFGMAKAMEERFNVAHGRCFNPLGVTAISNWLHEVGEFFGKEREVKRVVEEEYLRIKDVWQEARRLTKGKIALIDGGDPMSSVGRGIAWGRMCKDLGMEPIYFNIPAVEIKGMNRHLELALSEGFNPLVVYADYSHHRRLSPIKIIHELGLDCRDIGLYIGDIYPRAIAEWDRPIFDPSNFPRVVTGIHCVRNRGSPGRRCGFKGAERFAMDVIAAHGMARRQKKPTFYGRVGSL